MDKDPVKWQIATSTCDARVFQPLWKIGFKAGGAFVPHGSLVVLLCNLKLPWCRQAFLMMASNNSEDFEMCISINSCCMLIVPSLALSFKRCRKILVWCNHHWVTIFSVTNMENTSICVERMKGVFAYSLVIANLSTNSNPLWAPGVTTIEHQPQHGSLALITLSWP